MTNTFRQGDALELARQLPDQSVNCIVTSPPYWGLRDYGHDGQIGHEPTPQEYVSRLVELFRELRRGLRDDGTLWLNLGDSYASQKSGDTYSGFNDRYFGTNSDGGKQAKTVSGAKVGKLDFPGLKPKDLVGIPWRVALALQDDGWYLRSDIIWAKPNPMPESVTDRPTKAHEYIFLLSKSARYWYDAEAVKEPVTQSSIERSRYGWNGVIDDNSNGARSGSSFRKMANEGAKADLLVPADGRRNKRTVWTIATQPYPEAHFAVFPPALIEPCILAGCPAGGVVLDPFMGSGTVAQVAIKHHRQWIGFEINDDYIKLAEKRIAAIQPVLWGAS